MPSLPPYGDFKRPAIAWSIAATACTANFLDIFQASMVLFGLSPIAEDLAFTPYDINWVIVAYTITFATFLLFAGQFADRWGVRNVFLVGAGTLLWSNLLSAFAPNQQALLAGRALAGVGAAFTCATGISIISHVFKPGKNRNAALSLYVACGPIASAMGVIVGALLTASPAGWRSPFWVSSIFAGFAFSLGFCLIPDFGVAIEKKASRFDYFGMGTFTAGTALLVYGFNDAENRGWKAASTISCIVLGGLLLVAFPFVEARVAAPAVPQSVLRNRHVLIPLTTFGFIGGGWTAWFFVATQVALNSFHYSTVLAGCYFLPATVASIIGGGIGNFLVGKGKVKILIVGGYIINMCALIPWGLIRTSNGPWYTIVFAMLYLFSAPPIVIGAQTIILHEIPTADHGTASALMNVSYQFGASLILAVVNIAIGSTGNDGTQGMLAGYNNGMWTLLGFTGMGLLLFIALYLPLKPTQAGVVQSETKETAEMDASTVELGTVIKVPEQ